MAWGGDRPQLSPEWRRMKPKILARDNYTCQLRWRDCTGKATEVDHIVNRDAGGQDTMENGQSLCHTCHAKKTAIESRKKRKANKEACIHPAFRMKHPGLK